MGKGGGALSMWIKEFTALVFTQTIQAFIYAIIISIILFGMVQSSGEISSDDNNSALGLMATFALLSVFKVEEMSKKIFGIGDTKASHGNAMKSIAKTAIAAKLGSRVLNNAGKFLGGIRSINQAGQDRRKAKKRLDEDMKDNGFELGADGKPVQMRKSVASSSAGGGMSDAQKAAFEKAKSAKASGDMEGYKYNMGVAVGLGKSGGGSSGGGSSSAGGGDAQMSDAAYRRVKNALRTYEDKAAEINKARNEGIKSMISSVTESAGSIFGATTGAVLGGADGDIDEMLQGLMAGAGAGDIVGKNVVNAVDRAAQFVQRNYKREAGMNNKELQRAINGYKEALSKANVNYNSSKIDVSDLDI